ncbi:MAG TPA: dipeptidase [Rectinemataceae bacterium]|nr:dipeptidase [Rectinemataceae bacterium]
MSTPNGSAKADASLAIVDGHSDALLPLAGKSLLPGETELRDFFRRNDRGHVDLPRLLEGGVGCQVMAVFCDDEAVSGGAARATLDLLDLLSSLYDASKGRFVPVLRAADVAAARAAGAVGSLAAIEGGESIEGDLALLRGFYRLGVRLMTLTHNRRNALGRGVRTEGSDGLSEFGRSCVREMERLGMIVDASHLSDAAFDDLAAAAERPFVASHSNARAVHPDLRNLDDARIEAVARSGGVVGLTFVPYFVAPKGEANLERFCGHIDRVVEVGGIDCAALGSDFDGFAPGADFVLADCSRYEDLIGALRARGYSGEAIAKIMGGNWLRVFGEVLG